MAKEEIYKRIKIAGLLAYIPLLLGIGPLSGYFAGEYLRVTFGFPTFLPFVLCCLGFVAAGLETARIVRLVRYIDSKV